jgi:hypothetical protein
MSQNGFVLFPKGTKPFQQPDLFLGGIHHMPSRSQKFVEV